jgi:hypothetical protein
LHFWVGSFCSILGINNKSIAPQGFIAISDVITLVEDMGNQIPDKSWMLYLLEIFNIQNVAIELNLICQFDNQDYFEAIFNGVNRYRFKQILPTLGHAYLRQIIIAHQKKSIIYILEDQNTKQIERFELSLLNIGDFVFEGKIHFTGIEWWNKMGNFPYPIKYGVEISQLMYGLCDNPSDSESIIYRPYNALIPNNEGSNIEYPISFYDVKIRDDCVCYSVAPGTCKVGLQYC